VQLEAVSNETRINHVVLDDSENREESDRLKASVRE
jgi:hypothetical protein